MMKYVTFSPDGALTGSYMQDVQPEHMGCYIEVTDEQRRAWTSYRANAARDGVELIDPPAVDLDALRGRLAAEVDDCIAGIYLRWTRFESEYTERESAARAFATGAYQGVPGEWVTAFADPAGMSYQAAADLIIAQADALRLALRRLGAQRMRKYEIFSAGDVATAQSVHNDILALVHGIAAGLQ